MIAYYDAAAGRWVVLPSVVDTETNTITAKVSHFTTFAVIAVQRVEYDLTVSSTTGGSVTAPGEGVFTRDMGAVVSLVARADEGYGFVNWTGDVDTVADVDAAETTITMNGDYAITANFEAIPRPVNWPLIGGIIGGVVVIGLLVLVFVRRRKKRD